MKPSKFSKGDRVGFDRTFLALAGITSGWGPLARGRIERSELSGQVWFHTVRWDDSNVPSVVCETSLIREKHLPAIGRAA